MELFFALLRSEINNESLEEETKNQITQETMSALYKLSKAHDMVHLVADALDKNGILYITGRKKNLIILSNGKNVYPEEIEADLQKVEGVSEVVVYAGESRVQKDKITIVAEIFPDEDLLKDKGICDFQTYFEDQVKQLNAKMPPYKAVKCVKIRDTEFQKNTSRKITRFSIDKTID